MTSSQPASQAVSSSTLPIPAASCLQLLLPFCQRLLLIVIGQLNQLPLLPFLSLPFQFQFLGFNGVCLIAWLPGKKPTYNCRGAAPQFWPNGRDKWQGPQTKAPSTEFRVQSPEQVRIL